MRDIIDILNLLCASRPLKGTVGWREGVAVEYGEFVARVHLWRTLLLGTPGSRFALYFSDGIEFAAALFGSWHAGKTVYLPSDTLPATCVALGPVVDGWLGEFPADCAPFCPGKESGSAQQAFDPLSPEFVGLVVYTSGSTGTPQAIAKKLSQLATEVATLEQLFGASIDGTEVVATVSHQHIYGLLFKVLWPLAAARPIHARSLTYPEELAQATAARDCILISSPAHLKRLPESPVWAATAHRVHTVFSSGGPLPLEVSHITEQLLGEVPVEVYGSSETGGIAWRQRHPGTDESWAVMPGVTARIDSDGEVLEIRSPHLPNDNWFRTSDHAQATSDARFALHGRIDRIVKIEEKRISLNLIETQLIQSPLVTEACVLVIEGDRQRVAAFVVLSETGCKVLAGSGKHALNCQLRDHLANAIERIALPRSWRYLNALPVNAQGKTTRAELLALLEEEKLSSPLVSPQKKLLERDAQRVLFELVAPHTLVYFDGHFPQALILPGVAQVEWAVTFAKQCFTLPPLFRGIHALKFQRVIRPDTAFSLELLHDPARGSVTFKYFSAEQVHASGRLMFGAADV